MSIFRIFITVALVVFLIYQIFTLIVQIKNKVKVKKEKAQDNVNKQEEDIIDGVELDNVNSNSNK